MDETRIDCGEIEAQFPGIYRDLEDVAKWFGCDLPDLSFSVSDTPISHYRDRILGLLDTYPQFPNDASRTRKILKKLKEGEPMRPIFVDPSDGFILEGRHRIVAFHLFGATSVPTAFVSVAACETQLNSRIPNASPSTPRR